MNREKAVLAVLLTLEEPSKNMVKEAKGAGQYTHAVMGRDYNVISIVTAQEIVDGARLDIPMAVDVLKAAQSGESGDQQLDLGL